MGTDADEDLARPDPGTRAGQEAMKRAGIVPYPIACALTRPYWDAAREHRLVLQRCSACLEYQHPPAEACRACTSTAVAWVEVSGRGTVFSFIVDHRNEVPGHDGRYVVAFITPEEAGEGKVRLATNVIDCDPASVTIGMPVVACFVELKPGIVLPQFRPALQPSN